MYQAKSGVKNFSLYWGRGGPSTKIFFPVWTCIKPNLVSRIFPFTRGRGVLWVPPQTWDWEPSQTWDWDPPTLTWDRVPPLGVDWQTENNTFPHPSDAGGNELHVIREVDPNLPFGSMPVWPSKHFSRLSCRHLPGNIYVAVKKVFLYVVYSNNGEASLRQQFLLNLQN